MTRGSSGERVRFGVTEWASMAAVVVVIIGGLIDMRVQQAVTVQQITELKIQTTEILRDHELRIRALEAERRLMEGR